MVNEKLRMRKQLGLLEGVALILGIIFGSGVFISPKAVLEMTGSIWGSLTVWVACGVLSTFGALCYAELGQYYYVFIHSNYSSTIVHRDIFFLFFTHKTSLGSEHEKNHCHQHLALMRRYS